MAQLRDLGGGIPRDRLLQGRARISGQALAAFRRRLTELAPKDRLFLDRARMLLYSYDATGERHFPDAVALPETVDEVVALVGAADQAGAYVISRGASTNLSGGTTPILGGLVISTLRLQKILSLQREALRVRVEAGVVNAQLQRQLAPLGLFFPPDPASHNISTLGGNVAENSGGPHCVKYGVTTHYVVDVDVVLCDGRLVTLPPAGDARAELDLTGIVCGSEGTLGLITAMTLQVAPSPQGTRTMLAVFGSLDEALGCVAQLVAQKVVPATLELLDKVSIQVVERFAHAGYPTGAEAVLLIEVDGSEEAIEAQSLKVREVAAGRALSFQVAKTDAEAQALWRGRRAHYGCAAQVAGHLWVQDVTVPRPKLVAMIDDVLEIGKKYAFPIMTAAHAGDGNLHPIIPYDPSDADQVERMRAADLEIIKACVRHGGSVTGEHGVGIDKYESLALMIPDAERGIMMGIKEVFDPKGRLNPLKAVFPPKVPLSPETACAPIPVQGDRAVPGHRAEVAGIVAHAREAGRQILIEGAGRRQALTGLAPAGHLVLSTQSLGGVIDFDPENLTIEVGAGLSAGALRTLLEAEGFDLPALPAAGEETVGGLVARGARSWHYGYGFGLRDFLLAVEVVDGRGQQLRFGRKTMKNVAGYDVPKLAVGSWGRIGVITAVTFRLLPRFSRQMLGTVRGESAAALVDAALKLGPTKARPQGLVVRQGRGGSPELALWLCGPDVPATAAAIEERLTRSALEVSWTEGRRALEAAEDSWLEVLEGALAGGAFQEGGVSPEVLPAVASRVAGRPAAFFPGTGSFEVYAPMDPLSGAVRVLSQKDVLWRPLSDETWGLSEQVADVFDPKRVFARPASRVRHHSDAASEGRLSV